MTEQEGSPATGPAGGEPRSELLPFLYRRLVEAARLVAQLPRGRYRRSALPRPRAAELAALWLVERLPSPLHRWLEVSGERGGLPFRLRRPGGPR